MVVNVSGRPGYGFIAWDLDDINAALDAVYAYNWAAVSNPFERLGTADSEEALVHKLVHHPEQVEDVHRLVPDRGIAQRLFRAAPIEAYDGCAFCGCSFTDALEAAHIVRWKDATPRQRLDVRNGILLCATHHRLFDAAYIAPTTNYKVQYCDPDETDGEYSPADVALSSALHGKPLHLPADRSLWPLQRFIEERLRQDEWLETSTKV